MGARRYGTKRFRYNVKKNKEAGNSLNAVECEPVPTRVINTVERSELQVETTGWGTSVEDTFVECTFVKGTLVEWNIGRMEH